MNSEELYSRNWLLAYEAYVRDWLDSNNNEDYISDDDFFSDLSDYNVRFYNPDWQVKEIELTGYYPTPISSNINGESYSEYSEI